MKNNEIIKYLRNIRSDLINEDNKLNISVNECVDRKELTNG